MTVRRIACGFSNREVLLRLMEKAFNFHASGSSSVYWTPANSVIPCGFKSHTKALYRNQAASLLCDLEQAQYPLRKEVFSPHGSACPLS